MGVRNSRPRTSTNHIFVKYNGQQFMLITGSFQTKNILYSTKKKLLSGKLLIPDVETGPLNTILITCSKKSDGGLTFGKL